MLKLARIVVSGWNKAIERPCCGVVKLWGRWSDLVEVHSAMPRKSFDQSGRHEVTNTIRFLLTSQDRVQESRSDQHLLRSVRLKTKSSWTQTYCAYDKNDHLCRSPVPLAASVRFNSVCSLGYRSDR